MSFPQILLNGLWHSTTYDRYESILSDGAILPEPNVPDSSRWCTSQGPIHYSYVRMLGGVSLFDFNGFDPKEYCKHYAASWHTFVPINGQGGNAIWMEVNRRAAKNSLIEGRDLVERWKKENALGHNLMPLIEAAHIGPLHLSKISRVFKHSGGSWKIIA